MRSPGYLWLCMQRDLKRGLGATWHDYVTTNRIAHWENPHRDEPVGEVPVVVLTGKDTWRICRWMLASWFHHTGRNWRVVIHDDGTLDDAVKDALRAMGDSVVIRGREQADAVMHAELAEYPHCLDYRKRHPLSIKAFDVPHFIESERYLLLDSDVLFFRRPEELLQWVDEDDGGCWFNADVSEPSPLPPAEALEQLGIALWPKVNSGLCCLRRSITSWVNFNQWLEVDALREGNPWRVEQTLIALGASAGGIGGLLPSTYEVSLGDWMEGDVVARHYVGAVRQRYFAEAIRRAAPVLLGVS